MQRSDPARPGDPGDRTHRDDVGPGGDGLLSTSVVEAIATVNGVPPTRVDFQLYDYLDLDALDRLYSHTEAVGGTSWKVAFTVDDLDVVVRDDGDVTVGTNDRQ